VLADLSKRILAQALHLAGLEVRRTAPAPTDREHPRNSLIGLLRQARNVGLAPATVIDVGAAYGAFALECHGIFPHAHYVLVEPLKEYKPFLEEVTRSIPTAEYILAAAAASAGKAVINVHPDLVGSSLNLEDEDSGVNGVPRTVDAIRLDSLITHGRTTPPFLLKIDVQGAELDVLSGAEGVLQETEYVLLEVSFFEFFQEGPQFHEVVAFMKSAGFFTYDICGLQHRPLDGALSQADMAFVKEKGLFRKHHYYATRRQREEQDRKLQSARAELIEKLG
jgi:FkbM family methyltransferase